MAIKNLRDVHLTAGLQDKDGQLGTSGQILSSTGSQVDWIDQGDIVVGETDKAKSVTIRVKNSTAIAMSKGQVICEAVSASPPNGNLIEVALADNNGTNTMPALGVLNEDLDAAGGANDEGDAIMFGKVSGINTSAFSVGDEVFVDDTPGGLTITKPTGTKYIQKVGVVIRDDASNGTIEVFGAGRVNDVPTPLYVDHANQRLGIGTTSPETKLDVYGTSNTYLTVRNSGGGNKAGIRMYGGSAGISHIWHDDTETNPPGIHFGTSADTATTPTTQLYIKGSNGNVGIGTTSPATPLHIRADAPSIRLQDITSTDNHYLTGNNGELRIQSSGYMTVRPGNAVSTTFLANGNVGIGTTSPGAKLQISTTMTALPTSNIFLDVDGSNVTGGGGSIIFGTSASAGTATSYNAKITGTRVSGGVGGDSQLGFWTTLVSDSASSQERMTITKEGNVGIGTTNPGDKLEVNGTGVFGTGSAYALKLKSSSGARGIEISDNNGVDRGGIDWSASDFVIRNASDANLFKINYSSKQTNLYGNLDVSVAPTAAWMNLVNSGETAFRLTTYNNGTNNGSSAYAFKHGLYYNTTENAAVTFWRGGGSTGGFLTFTTNNGAERMRIDSSGNVGIGTTSPGYNLVVGDGTQDTESRFYFSDGSYTSVRGYGLYMSRTFSYIRPVTDESQTLNIGALNSAWGTISNNASLHTFGKDSTEFMRINSSGNVGIGTTSPLEKLHVAGTVKASGLDVDGQANSSTNLLQYTRTDSTQPASISYDGTGGFDFNLNGGTVKFSDTNGGSVGIGTTSPLEKLHVEGNLELQSNFQISSNSGNYWQRIRTVDDSASTANAFNFETRNGSGSYLPHMVIRNDGNVGIGTTSPSSKLQVTGSTQSTQFSVGSSGTMQLFDYGGSLHIYSTAGTDILLGGGIGGRQNDVNIGNGNLNVNGDIAANNFISIQGLDTGNPSASSEEIRLSGYGVLGNRSAMYITNGHATGTLRFGAGGSGGNHGSNTKMVLNSSGNLGIGTTSPTKRLQISHSDANNGLLLEHTSEASGFQILQNIRQTEGLIWQKQTSGSFTSNLMTLGYDGDLGIGTTSPAGKLDVSGNIRASAGSSGGYEINTGYGVHGMKSYYGTLYFTTSVYAGGVNGISYKSMSASAFYVNSDYRLKSNVTALENAIERVKKLNVCRFNWKDKLDEEKVDGFIAHEVAEVIPEAVTGDKDAVREDGTLDPQQIDQSKVVPLLTAALKEAIEKIEQLENRIQTLENN